MFVLLGFQSPEWYFFHRETENAKVYIGLESHLGPRVLALLQDKQNGLPSHPGELPSLPQWGFLSM